MRRLVITALAAMAFISSPLLAKATAAPEIGKPAPDFETTDINGKEFKLSEQKGKIVVLEWTNHKCPFVRKHYDSGNMQSAQKTAGEKGVEWITIVSSGEGRQGYVTPEEQAGIIKEEGAKPNVAILDPSGEIGKKYDAKTTPHMYVIDTDGNLAYAGAIDSNSSPNPATIEGAENYVLAAIDSLQAGEPVARTQTQPYGCSVKYSY